MRRNVWTLVAGVGLGAALMYLLDEDSGRRRRALARAKAVRALRRSGDGVRIASRRVSNRARGLAAGVRSRLRAREIPDDVLKERVRSALGHVVAHPSAVDVAIQNGRVVLQGSLTGREADRLLTRVARVRGVKSVENRLDHGGVRESGRAEHPATA
jgi:hyperosmotically inducible protein